MKPFDLARPNASHGGDAPQPSPSPAICATSVALDPCLQFVIDQERVLLSLIRGLLPRGSHEAHDVLQSVIVDLLTAQRKGRGPLPGLERPWLVCAVRHRASAVRRRQASSRARFSLDQADEDRAWQAEDPRSAAPEEELGAAEALVTSLEQLVRVIDRLPRGERQVVLARAQGLRNGTLARRLRITTHAAEQRFSQASKKLAERLGCDTPHLRKLLRVLGAVHEASPGLSSHEHGPIPRSTCLSVPARDARFPRAPHRARGPRRRGLSPFFDACASAWLFGLRSHLRP